MAVVLGVFIGIRVSNWNDSARRPPRRVDELDVQIIDLQREAEKLKHTFSPN